ncbi:MAG: FtsX-like permease family protein [Dongiaceae bacterium]
MARADAIAAGASATGSAAPDAGGWALALKFARRELRGGIKGFRLFLLCLALGVAIIAAVGSVTASALGGLERDAKGLLGGDLEFRLLYQPIDPAQQDFLRAQGTVSETRDMRAMARASDGNRTLVELKAVDALYPLYGAARLDPLLDLQTALGQQNGRWGAVAERALVDRLGLAIGQSVSIGTVEYELRGVIEREPDRGASVFILGPRLMIANASLEETGLVQEGSLIQYHYRLALPPGTDPVGVVEASKANFPDALWRVRGLDEAAPSIQRFIDRTATYLTLVGLSTLLVGGVGVGNAVRAWLDGKIATVATLKCLGASQTLIYRIYLLLVAVMALIGIAIGLAIGAIVPFAIAAPLGDRYALALDPAIYAEPLLLAAGCGFLVAIAFSLFPLIRVRAVPPGTLFRDLVQRMEAKPAAFDLLLLGAIVAALVLLATLTAGDRMLTLWFAAGTIVAFFLFHLAARGLKYLTRRLSANEGQRADKTAAHPGTRWGPIMRLALANIGRPGAPTTSALLSLGLGLTVLVMVALVQANLERELVRSIPAEAPAFYFIDIQGTQIAEFETLVSDFPGVSHVEQEPMLRGRITAVDGVPADRIEPGEGAAWALRGDRGVTWTATPPADSELLSGEWWPADYAGPNLVSIESGVGEGLALEPGDTITVNVLGRPIEATIANLRIVDWTRLDINFVFVFSPGALAGAPSMHIATAQMDSTDAAGALTAQAIEAQEIALQRAVTDRFPNVSAIRVKDAIQAVASIIEGLGTAISLAAMVTLAASLFVLAAAIAAQTHRRRYDAVVLKVLGATRRDIAKSFTIEYGLLGIAAALLALLLGHVAAWALVTFLLETPWSFDPAIALAIVVGGTLAAMVLGFLGTWRVLGTKAAPYLRNE